MNNKCYLETIHALSNGFCGLKGVGHFNPDSQGELKIEFEEWEWEVGVGLYGFWQYADHIKSEKLIDALADWYGSQLKKGLPAPQINTTAPMLTLVLLAEHLDRSEWKKDIEQWADYLMEHFPRVDGCGFQHVVKERINEGQLWDDTLFMTGLFLAKAGEYLQRPELTAEAELQFLVHAHYLTNVKTGLWYHGWTSVHKHHFADAYWARGNAWITVAIPELFSLLPNGISPAVQMHLSAILNAQIETLTTLQSQSGMWHTLLDDPASPLESSATAGIACGILKAHRMGLVNDKAKNAADQAVSAVMSRIDEQGIVLEASDGTAMGHDLQYYFDIKNAPVPYAQALAMMLMIEVIKGEKE
ncbi:glycoside hydrolase family 88/105 protein [Psychromonas ossibalaenae]|uniref:beta-galactosidase BglB n=1 Tax=Psychromonas ossibalaenae TaxID=444922 RepID=UPI000381DE53|nr:glycoside hydrolase family 88 protein [Psychromonas ossibalaenae]